MSRQLVQVHLWLFSFIFIVSDGLHIITNALFCEDNVLFANHGQFPLDPLHHVAHLLQRFF